MEKKNIFFTEKVITKMNKNENFATKITYVYKI